MTRKPLPFSDARLVICLLWALLVNECVLGDTAMRTEQMKEFAARYTTAWCNQDAASVASFFTEKGTLFVNGSPAEGREAITAVAQGFMSAFPDMVLLMDNLEFSSDQVIYHWTFIGTNTGPGGTGNAVHFSGYEEWTFGSEGLIEHSMGHFDAEDYQRQLGVSE